MQLLVRDHDTMIAASVQGDVDRIPKWSHARVVEARFLQRIAVIDMPQGSPQALSRATPALTVSPFQRSI
jgi:hypothetical protein